MPQVSTLERAPESSFIARALDATPQFARQYRVDCSYCHVAPPRLNAQGLAFMANNYSFAGIEPMPSHATFPVMVWNTFDVERRHTADLTKGFPSRVEPISIGKIGSTRAAYFIEWRALSQSIGGKGRLSNRSGRFEDLFIRFPVTRGNSLMVTAGQFRALQQYDVSQRLSLSEPLVFSSGLPADAPARSSRLTGLRGFAPSSRQPALRLDYQRRTEGGSVADGWYMGVTLPLTGELTIPLAKAASFEFENRLKGLFVESYARRGTNTLGGHVFTGRDRHLGSVVVTRDITPRLAVLGAVGRFWTPTAADTRWSVGSEFLFAFSDRRRQARGSHRSQRQRRRPAVRKRPRAIRTREVTPGLEVAARAAGAAAEITSRRWDSVTFSEGRATRSARPTERYRFNAGSRMISDPASVTAAPRYP